MFNISFSFHYSSLERLKTTPKTTSTAASAPSDDDDDSSESKGLSDDVITKIVILSVLILMFIMFIVYYMGLKGKKIGTFGKKKRSHSASHQEDSAQGRSESKLMEHPTNLNP